MEIEHRLVVKDDRTEARLLLAVLRERWDEADTICARQEPDGATFLELAYFCDVQPRLHALMEGSGRLRLLGDAVADRLTAARHKCRTDNLLLLAMLERALDVLRAAQIVPVVLKGVAVLHQFGVPFDERQIDDVDLLVAPGEYSRALEALMESGRTTPSYDEPRRWLGASFEASLLSPGPVAVLFDIHTHIAQQPRYRVEIAEVLGRAVPLQIAGRAVRCLEQHDQAAHLLLHHLQHYFDRRLKWALDFRLIVEQPGFDWHRLAERLRAWGGLAVGAMSLRHIAKQFPEAVPHEGLAAVPAAAWRRWLTLPWRSSHPLDLFRATNRRPTQLYLASVLLERPWMLPRYVNQRKA